MKPTHERLRAVLDNPKLGWPEWKEGTDTCRVRFYENLGGWERERRGAGPWHHDCYLTTYEAHALIGTHLLGRLPQHIPKFRLTRGEGWAVWGHDAANHPVLIAQGPDVLTTLLTAAEATLKEMHHG